MILVVDASALVAIGLREPERDAFLERLRQAEDVCATSVNIVEAGLAIVLRQQLLGLDEFTNWLIELRVAERPVSAGDVLSAYMAYGKGVHRAGLNLGDCYAYALAKQLDAPLLYKGNDFVFTDIRSALQPT